jgi:hypothetical protein
MRAFRRKLWIVLCSVVGAAILAGASYWWWRYSGGPGSSIETAIVITAPLKEYVRHKQIWLAKLYPDAPVFPSERYLVDIGDRLYDIEVLQTAKGEEKVYFDITAVK